MKKINLTKKYSENIVKRFAEPELNLIKINNGKNKKIITKKLKYVKY